MIAVFTIAFHAMAASAQAGSPQSLAGDWRGELFASGTSLPLVLHLRTTAVGKLTAALDSPAQGAYGLAGSDVQLNGSTLSFDVPSVHGNYSGTVGADGKTISGTWSQGKPLKLVLKQTATAAELAQVQPSPIDGDWAGVLRAGDHSLRVVFHFHGAPGGKIDGSLDSLDQGAMGIPCSNVKLKGQKLTLEVPAVHGTYSGTLSADGNKLSGTWMQGAPLTLDLTRQAKAAPATAPAPAAAAAPVPLKDLKPILDKEFAPVIAAWPQAGIVVGVLDRDERKVFAYGAAQPDSIFEIGSITKTFTALALAQMVEQHTVTLDEPVRELLPAGTVTKPASGPEITLLDLATQHSGLPSLPDNFGDRASRPDPYADYTAKDLYDYVAQHGAGHPEKTEFVYSNVGFGLLGQALADKAGESYAVLVRQQITDPLAMKDTAVELSAAQQKRLIQGYTGAHDQAHAWTFEAIAGAGALRSTADDLLTYADAYLHPDKMPAASSGPTATLAAALRLAQQPQTDAMVGMKIALAWLIRPDADVYWHNGGTGGYSSLLIFEPKRDRAVAVLYNCMDMDPGKPRLTDRVAANVRALMEGKPAPGIGQ
jgi:CubicO group peptidase (beta-lactamase class C family)